MSGRASEREGGEERCQREGGRAAAFCGLLRARLVEECLPSKRTALDDVRLSQSTWRVAWSLWCNNMLAKCGGGGRNVRKSNMDGPKGRKRGNGHNANNFAACVDADARTKKQRGALARGKVHTSKPPPKLIQMSCSYLFIWESFSGV